MIISEDKLKQWTALLDHADIKKLSAKYKGTYSYSTIRNAIKLGKGKVNLMVILDNFFAEKLKVINQLNKVEND